MAAQTGRQAVELAWYNVKPTELMNRASFENAITTLMAIGGSTNAIVHLMDTDVQSFGASSVAAGCTVLRGVATAVGGTIAGGDAIAGQVGGPGLDLESAWFYGSLVEVRGGSHFARVDLHAALPSIWRTRAASSLVEKGLVM